MCIIYVIVVCDDFEKQSSKKLKIEFSHLVILPFNVCILTTYTFGSNVSSYFHRIFRWI